MDIGSINGHSRHIHNVHRLQAELMASGLENGNNRLESNVEQAKLRWLNCRRSFAMLFMMLNRGNRFPLDEFHVKVGSLTHGDATFDAYVRVWRNKDHSTYNVRPYIDCGSNIIDHSFETEIFSNEYAYCFGTHASHSAKVVVYSEVDVAEVKLACVDGYEVSDMTDKNNAILLAALEDVVLPGLESTESTLQLITGSAIDPDLNPDHVAKFRIQK